MGIPRCFIRNPVREKVRSLLTSNVILHKNVQVKVELTKAGTLVLTYLERRSYRNQFVSPHWGCHSSEFALTPPNVKQASGGLTIDALTL